MTALFFKGLFYLTLGVILTPTLWAGEPRFITPEQAENLAPFDSPETVEYLTGEYLVTSVSNEKRGAILSPVSRDVRYRLVVVYPEGCELPAPAARLTLTADPGLRFRISSAVRGDYGILTIFAKAEPVE